MISAVGLALHHYDNGQAAAAQQVLESMTPGGRWQIDLNFAEVSDICQHRISPDTSRRNGNRICVEAGYSALNRCMKQSPDGRGAVWLLSGGDALAYGICCPINCPLARKAAA